MSLFEDMLNNKHYQELLSKLPNDERESVILALKQFVDTFEKHVIIPIENHKLK
jgi:hypothetical protein